MRQTRSTRVVPPQPPTRGGRPLFSKTSGLAVRITAWCDQQAAVAGRQVCGSPWVLRRPRLRLRFQPQTLGWSLGLRTSRVVVGATTSAGSVARGRGPCLSDGAGSALAWHPVYGSGSAGAECSQRVLAGLVHRQLAIEGGQLECAALRPLRTGNRELAPRVVQAAEGV